MKLLVTAGPTREKIDPIRFISNLSSGRMGYAVAAAAAEAGHEVTLISGPTALPVPPGVTIIDVISAAEMAQAVHAAAPQADVIIMAAAVADYRPAHPAELKMKKGDGSIFLELERTEDILASLGKNRMPEQLLVGFAAETDHLKEHALDKLKRKNLDWIAANSADESFGRETNRVILFHRSGKSIPLPPGPKTEVARAMLEVILS